MHSSHTFFKIVDKGRGWAAALCVGYPYGSSPTAFSFTHRPNLPQRVKRQTVKLLMSQDAELPRRSTLAESVKDEA